MKYEDGDLTLDNSIVATQDWADGWIDGVLDEYISYGTNTSTDGLSIQNIDNTDEINPTDARLVFGQTAKLSTHITNIGGASLELGFNADLSAVDGSVILEASNEGEPATSVTISGNGIVVDAIDRPISVTTGDDFQIMTDGLSISATTATLNNSPIATEAYAVEEQNWQLLATITSDSDGLTYNFPNQSTVAYKDVYVRMTLPSGSSWSTYPNLKLLYRNNDTDTTVSQYTFDIKSSATTGTQYSFVYSEAKGNARETFNGFTFAANNSYVTSRMNPYSATEDGKPWFRILNSNNYINKFTSKILPAGTTYEFYVARPVTL